MRRSARVPYSVHQMLDLVNDIPAYPEFLHWCRGARIERSENSTVEAALEIGISGIHKTLRTKNTTADDAGEAHVLIEMLDGPLERLQGGWFFKETSPGESEVSLTLDYEIKRSALGRLLGSIFDEIASSQLKAFIRRAGEVYGGR